MEGREALRAWASHRNVSLFRHDTVYFRAERRPGSDSVGTAKPTSNSKKLIDNRGKWWGTLVRCALAHWGRDEHRPSLVPKRPARTATRNSARLEKTRTAANIPILKIRRAPELLKLKVIKTSFVRNAEIGIMVGANCA